MKKQARLTFLGTGGSMAVPVLGCKCDVCLSVDHHNKRLRPSALITCAEKKLLIDCGPDFRFQAIRQQLHDVDGMILTHGHYDHVGGLDDLRALFFTRKSPLPCYLSKATAKDIEQRFDYMFRERPATHSLQPSLELHPFSAQTCMIEASGLKLKIISYEQLGMPVNGVIAGNLAYVSDIRYYPESIFEDLRGVDILIVSALRFTHSLVHFSVDEAIDFSKRVGAKQTWLTHIAHELDHEKTTAYLPSNVHMAYDGLEIEFECDCVERS